MKATKIVPLAVIAALSLAACGGSAEQEALNNATTAGGADTATGEGTAASGDPVKLGIVTSLTGPIAESGKEVQEGFDLAISMINDAGGINGQPLEAVVEDDKSSPEQAVLAMRKLTGQGISILGGTITSPLAIAMSKDVENDPNLLFVMTAATTNAPLEAQTHGNIIGLSATSKSFGEVDFPFIEESGIETLAIVAAAGEYGDNEVKALEAYFGDGSKAVEIVATERFEMSQTDFSPIIAKLRSTNADGVFFTAAGTSIHVPFFRQAQELALPGEKFINAMSLTETQFGEAPEAFEGVYGVDLYVNGLDNPENETFVTAFNDKYGKNPTTLGVFGYESAMIIADAMEEAGTTTDVPAIAQTLREGTWKTPRGDLSFDEIGRSTIKPFIVTVTDGHIVEVP